MKRWIVFGLIVLVLIGSVIVLSREAITGFVVGEGSENLSIYSYTKGICNESNSCQDHVIECDGDVIVSIEPIEGAVIQFDEDWVDPRSDEDIGRIC